ncbi:MAG: hypothetical protein FWB88_08930 [Defluviitaleaceae bacterium]|nr:hypothetical protein [Defluviitaleaceae bacterium]MCL2239530.1 hypothetical protein [Defluviitaleaceae bacterium]
MPPHRITFEVVGGIGGSISANGVSTGGTSSIMVLPDGDVSFVATPNAGYQIRGWWHFTDPVNGTLPTFQLNNISGPHTVRVEFEQIPFTVTLNTGAGGTAWGTVGGVSLVLGVPTSATAGQIVSFNAQPNPGYHFTGWVVTPGGIPIQPTGAMNPVSHITMPAQNVTITATFAVEPEPRVTIQAGAGGWAFGVVAAENNRIIFQDHPTHVNPGGAVALHADADFFYRFSHWEVLSGGYGLSAPLNTTANPATFIMPANNIVIEARFVPRERRHNVILLDVSAGASGQIVTAGVQLTHDLLWCDVYINEVAVVKFSADVAHVFGGFVSLMNAPNVAGAVAAASVPAAGSDMVLALQTAAGLMPAAAVGTGRIHMVSHGLPTLPRSQDEPLRSGYTGDTFIMQDYLFWRQANLTVDTARGIHNRFYIQANLIPGGAQADRAFAVRLMQYLEGGPPASTSSAEAPPVALPEVAVEMLALIEMLRVFAQPGTELDLAAADINQDGVVDAADLVLFLRYYAS